jgi:hypothetical protein
MLAQEAGAGDGDITDDEFEALLDAMQAGGARTHRA